MKWKDKSLGEKFWKFQIKVTDIASFMCCMLANQYFGITPGIEFILANFRSASTMEIYGTVEEYCVGSIIQIRQVMSEIQI